MNPLDLNSIDFPIIGGPSVQSVAPTAQNTAAPGSFDGITSALGNIINATAAGFGNALGTAAVGGSRQPTTAQLYTNPLQIPYGVVGQNGTVPIISAQATTTQAGQIIPGLSNTAVYLGGLVLAGIVAVALLRK